MFRFRILPAAVIVLAILAFFALDLPTVSALPPNNDNFDSATAIGTLPFSDSVGLAEAAIEPGEPQPCSYLPNSIWYSFTPAVDMTLKADTEGSGYGSNMLINVYEAYGPTIYDLGFVGCASTGDAVTFTAWAGTTYYFRAGMTSCGYPPCPDDLQVNLAEFAPPPNDNFNSPAEVTALPFNGAADNTLASTEPGEPSWCYTQRTVWFKFTPAADTWLTADMNGSSFYDNAFNVYQAAGPGLGGLSFVDCANYGGQLTLLLAAGETYYFQAGDSWTGGGNLWLNLQEIAPPQPEAQINFYPYDPSTFDSISFYDYSYDPGGVGIASESWDFGDGTTAEGCCPTHQYAADGDYTVQLTVTTFDGRQATTSELITVATHDISITRFQVPKSAKAGQTRSIGVGLQNHRYPEYVRVDLYRSTPWGFEHIGFLEQHVPVRGGNRTTDFQFSYTFTTDDAALDTVNFRAVAYLVYGNDALPADNEAISLPVNVNP